MKRPEKLLRARERREKRIREQKIAQQASGKFIEENHSGSDYSLSFTHDAIEHYTRVMTEALELDDHEFLRYFRGLRVHIQTLLLKWPDEYPRGKAFERFVRMIDTYRSDPLGCGGSLKQIIRPEN